MNPEILNFNNDKGAVRIDVKVTGEEIAEAIEEVRSLLSHDPELGNENEVFRYENEYVLAKAANTAIYSLELVLCAATDISPITVPRDGSDLEFFFTCYPVPALGLSSLDPINLTENRIPVPGQSLKAARAGEDVDYIDDERVLKVEITNRLQIDIPRKLHERVVAEYTTNFQRLLEANHGSVEMYQQNMDEDSFKGMMNMEALNKLHYELALEAFFDAYQLELEEADIAAAMEKMFPGESDRLRPLFEARGDIMVVEAEARRAKAYEHIKANAL